MGLRKDDSERALARVYVVNFYFEDFDVTTLLLARKFYMRRAIKNKRTYSIYRHTQNVMSACLILKTVTYSTILLLFTGA